jgi:hypothetical protein
VKHVAAVAAPARTSVFRNERLVVDAYKDGLLISIVKRCKALN